mgnify:CR=1 FL=1
MLKNVALGMVLFTTMWFVPVAAETGRQDATVIRTEYGVRYEVPAGWEWTEFDGNELTIQHIGTKSGEKGKESSPNKFSIGWRKSPDDGFDKGWGDLDRSGQRTLPNGVTARWKAGKRFGYMYTFAGEATIGSHVLSVSPFGRSLDAGIVEAAFLRVAETLREVPKSAVLYHPSLGIVADRLNKKSWYNQFDSRNIAFRCWADGISGNTWIYTYPSSKVFPDTRKALADITGHYAKTESLKIGNVQRADVPGGEVLWTEQPGTQNPFLAAVRRDGRYFFLSVQVVETSKHKCRSDALREDFLAVAKSVRAWDSPKQEKQSAVVTKTASATPESSGSSKTKNIGPAKPTSGGPAIDTRTSRSKEYTYQGRKITLSPEMVFDMTGKVERADVATTSQDGSDLFLSVVLIDNGKQALKEFTEKNITREVGFIYNGKLVSVAVVRESISGGRLQISGGTGTKEELVKLASELSGK